MVCNGLYLQGISAPHPESGQPLHQGYFASADFFLTHFTPKSMENIIKIPGRGAKLHSISVLIHLCNP